MGHRLVLALLALGVLIAACATNPVTGKRELSLLSEGDEIQLGAQSDGAIVAQYGLVEDVALAAYVESIGQKMVPVSHRPDLKFHFRLLDDPVVNAFALPGGYVYITRGILAYLNDEAALAGVVGHEIGHVTARHGAQRYTEQTLYGLGLGLGAAVSETFARYAGVAATATQLLMLKYGRDDERQSDELGVEYATKLGYDTQGMAEFFRTLDQLSGGGGRLPSWASTHPDPGERYENVLGLTQQWQAQAAAAPYSGDREGYLRRIEGVVFGANPRQGFVKDDTFYHPDLNFQFPVPPGWSTTNMATQVILGSPEQDAAVFFLISPETTLEAAVKAYTSQDGVMARSTTGEEGLVELDRERFEISGWPARRLESQVVGGENLTRVVSTFIQRDNIIYVFHGLTGDATYKSKQLVLRQSADGLAPVIDPAVKTIQPIVLHLIEAPSTGRFSAAVARYPIPADAGIDLEGLALMNGMTVSSTVQKGQLIKVLRRSGGGA